MRNQTICSLAILLVYFKSVQSISGAEEKPPVYEAADTFMREACSSESWGTSFDDRREDGSIRCFGLGRGGALALEGIGPEAKPEAAAQAFIAAKATVLGIASKNVAFPVERIRANNGKHMVRMTQTYKGIPVFGAHAVVHLDNNNRITAANFDILTNTKPLDDGEVALTPVLNVEQAKDAAKQVFRNSATQAGVLSSEAVLKRIDAKFNRRFLFSNEVYVRKDVCPPVLSEEIIVTCTDASLNSGLLINSLDGSMIFAYGLCTGVLNRRVMDADGGAPSKDDYDELKVRTDACIEPLTGCSLPTGDQSNPYTEGVECIEADTAWDMFSGIYTLYYSDHSWDSFNGSGHIINAFINYEGTENAYWASITTEDPLDYVREFRFNQDMVADDVIGHEFTHAVTEYTSQLTQPIWFWNPGECAALNESFSDFFGERFDQGYDTENDLLADKWLIAEDTPFGQHSPNSTPRCSRSINPEISRSMIYPNSYGDPCYYLQSNYWYGGNIGSLAAHTNCGVGNKLMFLLSDGQYFMYYICQPIGIDAVAELLWWLQNSWLGPSSDYRDVYYGLRQAVISLDLGNSVLQSVLTACKAAAIAPQAAFSIRDIDGNYLWDFDCRGNMVGFLEDAEIVHNASSELRAENPLHKEFIVKFNGDNVMRVDSSNGKIYIKGLKYENWSLINENEDEAEFIIRDVGGYPEIILTEDGNLFLRGSIIMRSAQ